MKIYQTNQPDLPDLDRLADKIRSAFEARWLTNFGSLHDEFERGLCSYLGVDHALPVTNATVGLQAALNALDVRGDVITTPFTFPATYHALLNRRDVRPVFVDILDDTFCISPEAVEQAITPATSAIVAVHAYGYPCDHAALAHIAESNGLKLIYDAAPCFGVTVDGQSLAGLGDASVLSFHATKVFSTAEGGAIICRDDDIYRRCKLFINFGIASEDNVMVPGLNGKLDEIRSALGSLGLEVVADSIARRREVVSRYISVIEQLDPGKVVYSSAVYDDPSIELNYAYFPIRITSTDADARDQVFDHLRSKNIVARKYYHPNILDTDVYDQYDIEYWPCPRTRRASSSVICLPVNPFFTPSDVDVITHELRQAIDRITPGAAHEGHATS